MATATLTAPTTATAAACVAAVQAVAPKITRAEAMAIFDRVAARQEAIAGDAKMLSLDRDLAIAAASMAGELRRAMLVEKRKAVMAAMTFDRARTDLDRFVAGGLTEPQGLMALFHGTEAPIFGVRRSAWALTQAYQRRYLAPLMGAIARDRPHLERMLKDGPFNDRVTREMEEIRPGRELGLIKVPHAKGDPRCRCNDGCLKGPPSAGQETTERQRF